MSMIKTIRKGVFKCTQTQFAAICGVTQSTIARWEKDSSHVTLAEMMLIRDYAVRHKLQGDTWRDAWFFEPPALDGHNNIVWLDAETQQTEDAA